MELKEGMYVRTDDGEIGKITHIETETFSEPAYALDIFSQGMYKGCKWFNGKASHNIIDLIEVGDYVNGDLVLFTGATTWDNDGNVLVKQVHINHNGYDWWLREEQIKSIVTREQFESMQYRLGD